MNLLLKALVALIIGVVVAWIVGKVCLHFNIDAFWGWLAGVVVGIAYFLQGPPISTTPRV